MKYAYLICGNGKFFPFVFNRKVAILNGKHHNMEVYRMPYQGWKDGNNCAYGWDVPTFTGCAEKIYPA